jgi:hypothetical protein
MGGKSTTSKTDTSNSESTTAPWLAANPTLHGILSQINSGLSNTGVTGAENDALGRLTANAGRANPYEGQINGLVGNLLEGGGAMNQAGTINQAYQDYQRRLNPIADGQNIGPNGNPALKGYLDTIANDVQTRVNGMFAGAGRDLSGNNQGQLARGIAEGTAPILASQYNTDVGQMRSAADALYGAGNTTGGILTGLNQQGLANKQAGVGMSNFVGDQFANQQKQILEAEALRRGIPVQALGLLANIGIPIAGLGSQSTGKGTATSTGEHNMSGVDKFHKIADGFGKLMPKFPISFGS